MRLSTDRILTTHAGSLPRPDDLLETLYDRSDGRPLSAEANGKIQAAVTQAVRQQADAGIDIIDDGEVGKSGFIGYVNSRLDGFNPTPIASAAIPGRARASSSRSRTITARAPTPVLAALPRSGFARCR